MNEAWDRFAAANAGRSVTSDRILQRSLWDYITDETTRELYRQILKQIREGRTVRFTLRCDSPDCRRLLQMDVGRGAGNTVEFRTRTLSEESRDPIDLPTAQQGASGELIRTCGWCKKLFVDGAWLEIEPALQSLELFERSALPKLTHGICEPCYERIQSTFSKT